MKFELREEPMAALADYASVSIAFEVGLILRVPPATNAYPSGWSLPRERGMSRLQLFR